MTAGSRPGSGLGPASGGGADRRTQRVRFGEDVEVTANFADVAREGVDGGCIEVRIPGAVAETFCP